MAKPQDPANIINTEITPTTNRGVMISRMSKDPFNTPTTGQHPPKSLVILMMTLSPTNSLISIMTMMDGDLPNDLPSQVDYKKA